MNTPLSQQARSALHGEYLQGLNDAQREAVEKIDGAVLVLAGAGTGKTRALTTRIAHIVATARARPFEILAVTFTNKAAREMQHRVEKLIPGGGQPMAWLGTFHSVSSKILRQHAELVGLKPSFTILDTDDQIRLLKQHLSAHNVDEKRWPARLMAGLIDRWKNRALTPDRLTAEDRAQFNGLGVQIYGEYQQRLKSLNAVDFGDLLLHTIEIFKNHPDVLANYHARFKYILVDEYQDTNAAQYLWLRLLAQGTGNICCVGDDDQSIYGWRGAEVGNILKFERDFPGAHLIRLEQNYRSTPHILAAASRLISGNEDRLGKTLWTTRETGEKIRLMGHWDGEEEARWIGEDIEAQQSGTGGNPSRSLEDIAILVRASHQMRAFEDRFLNIGLPYRVIGGPRFYERMEIRDAMAYFRLTVSTDDDLAFERVVNTPKRGIGQKGLQSIQKHAREAEISLFEAAEALVSAGGLPVKARQNLREFCQIIRDFSNPSEESDHVEMAGVLLDAVGYTAMWQNDKSPEAPGRLDNLKELIEALESFDNLQGFLEHVSLVMENESDEVEEKLSIMTLHGAKGLEFPVVYLPGWEEGLFPSQRSLDESGVRGLEEERRLAYVGITRAEEILTISFAANRRIYNQWQNTLPSRFVDELPEEHVDVLSAGGVYGGSAKIGASDMLDQAAQSDVYNAPGWKRMQSQSRTPQSQYIQNQYKTFELGERVFHQKFGYGYVIEVEGGKCTVNFEHSGEKHLMAQFLSTSDDIPF